MARLTVFAVDSVQPPQPVGSRAEAPVFLGGLEFALWFGFRCTQHSIRGPLEMIWPLKNLVLSALILENPWHHRNIMI